jgi:REP element-mobilizing transposase RayT
MPNHCHLILFVPVEEDISKLVGNGKRFMAYEITKRLAELERFDLLLEMERSVKQKEKEIDYGKEDD